MIAVLVIFGLVCIGLVIGLMATAAAPVGYQDEQGFHYGHPHGKVEEVPLRAPQGVPQGVPRPKLA